MDEFIWIQTGPNRFKMVKRSEYPDAEAVERKPKGGYPTAMRTEFLTQKERRSYEDLIGEPVMDASDVRRAMKKNDLRFVDRGEMQDVHRRELREWKEDPNPETRGALPEHLSGGKKRKRKPFKFDL